MIYNKYFEIIYLTWGPLIHLWSNCRIRKCVQPSKVRTQILLFFLEGAVCLLPIKLGWGQMQPFLALTLGG